MKRYTAQEIRELAEMIYHGGAFALTDPSTVKANVAMLRQAADDLDNILNEIDIIEKMPTADLDGSAANQKVNGERLMAKVAFYQKVKKIVGEAHNV